MLKKHSTVLRDSVFTEILFNDICSQYMDSSMALSGRGAQHKHNWPGCNLQINGEKLGLVVSGSNKTAQQQQNSFTSAAALRSYPFLERSFIFIPSNTLETHTRLETIDSVGTCNTCAFEGALENSTSSSGPTG